MKYGNMGGWKAVRTFNRDARIRDGLSPYGYKPRYSRTESQKAPSRGAWEQISKRQMDEATGVLSENYVYFTGDEHADFGERLDECVSATDIAGQEWNDASAGFFLRSFRQTAWRAEWPSRLEGLSADYNHAIRQRLSGAQKRRARHEALLDARLAFQSAFNDYVGSFENNDDLCIEVEAVYAQILEESAKMNGWSVEDGTVIYPAECWEDIVSAENKNQGLFWKCFDAFVTERSRDIKDLGLQISKVPRRQCLLVGGTEYPFKKLRV